MNIPTSIKEAPKNLHQKKRLLIFILALVFLVIVFGLPALFRDFIYKSFQNQSSPPPVSEPMHAPLDYSQPVNNEPGRIYISPYREGNYSSGGLIALSSSDEPVVNIGGYNIGGDSEVSLYETDETALLDYLTHDKDGNQILKNPAINKFRLIKSFTTSLYAADSGSGEKVVLPLPETGIFFLRVKNGKVSADSFILRSNIATLLKEGEDQYIFWSQDLKTLKSLTEGSLSVYNLQGNLKEIATASIGKDGVATTPLVTDADIALVRNAGQKAIVPINLQYLNTGYTYKTFQPKERHTKYFLFTDRPLYRPGDTVHFKSVLRDDDDARYTIPSGQATVKIYNGYSSDENLVYQTNVEITSEGTVYGEYKIPENSKTGYYDLGISIPGSTDSTISFNVDYFRKPEYSIDVSTLKSELIAGDKSDFTISGNYFSGQPLADQKVKYTIYSSDFYSYEYLSYYTNVLNDDYRYGYWGGQVVDTGEVKLDSSGKAKIDFTAKIPLDRKSDQIYSIEATIDNGSGNPSFARKNVLVYSGEYGIFRTDTSSYGVKVNSKLTLPVTLVSHNKTGVGNVPLTAKVVRENWIAYSDPYNKYPLYKKETENIPSLTAVTNSKGEAVFSFIPKKIGSYNLTVEGKDSKGNPISKTFYSYVYSNDEPFYFSDQKK